MDETAGWCNSFVLVLKSNVQVRLCLDPARLNQALIKPVHRGPTLKLDNAQCLSIIDASYGYHNLKLDKKPSYFTTVVCQFGRYRCKRLPFGVAPAGDMFQRKTGEIFKYLSNVFGIADGILVVGYDVDGKNHDDTIKEYYRYEGR